MRVGPGTVGYIAPEHLMGQPVDAAADQFALCVVLWEALHGQPPFVGATADAIGLAALHGEIQAPTSATVPRAIEAVLRQGLHPESSERHASAQKGAPCFASIKTCQLITHGHVPYGRYLGLRRHDHPHEWRSEVSSKW